MDPTHKKRPKNESKIAAAAAACCCRRKQVEKQHKRARAKQLLLLRLLLPLVLPKPPVASAGWRRHGVGGPQQQLPLQLLQWQRPQASVAAAIALAHVETPKTTAGKRRQKKTTKSLPSPHRHTNRVEVSPHTLQKPQNKGFANMRSPSSSPQKPVRSICCVLCVGG